MSLKSPTKAEREWMNTISQFGCIVCHLEGHPNTPAAVHHILKNGFRESHLRTIPLCDPGHHQNAPKESGKISRHPWWKRFEEAYGTEDYLLGRLKELLRMAA